MFAPILHGSHTSGTGRFSVWPAFLYLRNPVHASGMLCGPPPVGNPSVPLNATIDRIDCPAPAPSESEATSSNGRVMPDSSLDFRLSLIHISEPTRLGMISYAVFCLKKKKN